MAGKSAGTIRRRHIEALQRMLTWKEEHLESGSYSERSEPYMRGEIAALKHAIAAIEREETA